MGYEVIPVPTGTFLGRVQLEQVGSEEVVPQHPTFVGAVSYDFGRKFVVIGNLDGKLITSADEQEISTGARAAVTDTGRLIQLNSFTDVKIRQVGIDAIEFYRPQSIRKFPTVSLHFDVTNPITEEREKLAVDDKDIYGIFTGKRGGVVVFSGKGLHEETGLLFERETDSGGRSALILFMHPNEPGLEELNSIQGLKLFTDQLVGEFARDEDIEMQNRALQALEKSIRKGSLQFASDQVREQIFRLQVLSAARLGATTRERYYRSDLKQHIPDFKRGPGKTLGRVLHISPNYQRRVDEKIERLVVDLEHPLRSEVDSEYNLKIELEQSAQRKRLEEIESQLTTPRAIALWRNTNHDDLNRNSQTAIDFTDTVVSLMYGARTVDEFRDVHVLLSGLFVTEYARLRIRYAIDFDQKDPKKVILFYSNSDSGVPLKPTTGIRMALTDEALRRQQELGLLD
jgi:hypothetical protein